MQRPTRQERARMQMVLRDQSKVPSCLYSPSASQAGTSGTSDSRLV